jgi:AcrR family transcriptional regulator
MEILALALAHVNTVRYGRNVEDGKQNRDSWFDAGFKRLAAHGPQGLRIMGIAHEMGVTKGSFYWHFKGLREYQAALLAEWQRRFTQEIIQQVERAGGDVRTRLRMLLSSAEAAADRRLTLALRSWAINDPLANKALVSVDELRVAYVARLLGALGWRKRDAITLARFAYEALIGRLLLPELPLTAAQLDLILGVFIPK